MPSPRAWPPWRVRRPTVGKSSKITIGYKFYMTLHMGLSTAVDGIRQIVAGGKQLFVGNITESGDVQLDKPELFGGDQKEGGIVGTLSVMMGDADQQPHPLLVQQLGTPMPAFRGLATLLFDGEVSSITPYIKPWSFQVERYVKGWRTPVWEPDLCQVGSGMNPAHILYRAITDPVTGLGRDPSTLDLDKLKAAAQTLKNEGLGLCLKWSRSDVLNNFVGMVTNHVAGMWVDDPVTGKQYLKLLRGDYDVEALDVLDESNIIELSSFDQTALAGAINQVTVTYHDCETNKDAAVTVQNPAAILAQGRTVSQSNQYPGLWNGDLATRIAMRDLRGPSSLPARAKVKVHSTVEVTLGDVRAFSWGRLNVTRMPMRVLEIDRGTPGDSAITLTLSQDIYSMPEQVYVVVQPPLWTAPDQQPYPIAHQQLVEASYRDLSANLSKADLAQVDATAGYVEALAARPTTTSISYAVWSRTGGADFAQHGTGDFAPTAVLAADIPCEAGPTVVTITAEQDLDQAEIGSEVLLEGELCRLVAVDLANHTVTLARGCVDTVPVAHAAGARLWVTDQFTGVDRTEYITGETVDAKLLTVAGDGTLDASLAPIATLQLDERQIRPYAPGALTIAGESYPTDVTVDMPVAWAHRDRLLQADQLVDTAQTSIGPEPGTTYTVRVYQGGALKATYADIDGTSCMPDRLNADGTVRIEVEASRDGYKSWQRTTATFSYHWLKTMQQVEFGHGDGSTDEFQLADAAGQPITSDITVESIYRTDWQGRQLLYPAARQSLIRYTNSFTSWNKNGGGSGVVPTLTPAYAQGPDGNPTSASRLQCTLGDSPTVNDFSQILIGSVLAESSSVVASVWAKSNTENEQPFMLSMAGVSPQGPVTATTEWTRIATIFPVVASGQPSIRIGLRGGPFGSATTLDLLIAFANVQAGDTLTSYMDNPITPPPVAFTDYILGTAGAVSMGETPVQDATLDWSGTGR